MDSDVLGPDLRTRLTFRESLIPTVVAAALLVLCVLVTSDALRVILATAVVAGYLVSIRRLAKRKRTSG